MPDSSRYPVTGRAPRWAKGGRTEKGTDPAGESDRLGRLGIPRAPAGDRLRPGPNSRPGPDILEDPTSQTGDWRLDSPGMIRGSLGRRAPDRKPSARSTPPMLNISGSESGHVPARIAYQKPAGWNNPRHATVSDETENVLPMETRRPPSVPPGVEAEELWDPAVMDPSTIMEPEQTIQLLVSDAVIGESTTVEPEQVDQYMVTAAVMDHSWPIRFAKGKSNIVFPFQYRLTAANTAKAWIEHVVREPINWWPLSPRRHPLPEDSVWVEWQCVSRLPSVGALSE